MVFMYTYKYTHVYTHRVGTLYACKYVYKYIYIITLFLSWVKIFYVLTLHLEALKDETNIHLLNLFKNSHLYIKNTKISWSLNRQGGRIL